MSIIYKFSLTIMDTEKISEFNQVVKKYAKTFRHTSSHVLFNVYPIDATDVVDDLTFLQLESDDKNKLNKKLNDLIEELNTLGADYCLRNEDTGETLEYVKYVGSVDIKFDNMTSIPQGTYKKIDELKYTRIDVGYCKGYKPAFRPLETIDIGDKEIITEHIYVFSNSMENIHKLREYLSEKIREINPDLIIEHRQFT